MTPDEFKDSTDYGDFRTIHFIGIDKKGTPVSLVQYGVIEMSPYDNCIYVDYADGQRGVINIQDVTGIT